MARAALTTGARAGAAPLERRGRRDPPRERRRERASAGAAWRRGCGSILRHASRIAAVLATRRLAGAGRRDPPAQAGVARPSRGRPVACARAAGGPRSAGLPPGSRRSSASWRRAAVGRRGPLECLLAEALYDLCVSGLASGELESFTLRRARDLAGTGAQRSGRCGRRPARRCCWAGCCCARAGQAARAAIDESGRLGAPSVLLAPHLAEASFPDAAAGRGRGAARDRDFRSWNRAARADVGLLLEGTYPYVSGGVSAWVHELVSGFPDLTFGICFLGATPEMYGDIKYRLPDNVVHLEVHHIMTGGQRVAAAAAARRRSARPLAALAALHEAMRTGTTPGPDVVDTLGALDADAGLSLHEFLHDDRTFLALCAEYDAHHEEESFIDFFWTLRTMHLPLFKLASIARSLPRFGALARGVDRATPALWGRWRTERTGVPLRADRARHLHERAHHRSGARELDQGRARHRRTARAGRPAPAVDPVLRGAGPDGVRGGRSRSCRFTKATGSARSRTGPSRLAPGSSRTASTWTASRPCAGRTLKTAGQRRLPSWA